MDRRAFLGGVAAFVGGSVLAGCRDRSGSVGVESRFGPGSTTLPPSASTSTPGATATWDGELVDAGIDGLLVPVGFTARVVATTGTPVGPDGYPWHERPDGGATFAAPDGGWVYVSNSEVDGANGGVSALRFDPGGAVVGAGSILTGTSRNCAGGATPWATWLSCEEVARGQVWECDPFGLVAGAARPALGAFRHEAVAVHAGQGALFLTEDEPDGALYRFVPDRWGDLTVGELSVLAGPTDAHRWAPVPDPASTRVPTRRQVLDAVVFDGGEGIVVHDGLVVWSTKGDDRLWSMTPSGADLHVVYDGRATEGPLRGVDNIAVTPSGDLVVAEDGDDMQLVLVRADGAAVPMVSLAGVSHSEMAGPAFDPSGTRLYFSSQRHPGRTYEVSGPFDRL